MEQTLIHSFHINLPKSLASLFFTLCEINPELELKLENEILILLEKNFSFSEVSFFSLKLPFSTQETEILELSEKNPHLKLEWDEEKIIIHMSTLGFIGVFTAAILITLGIWNKKKKLGKIVDSSTGHDLIVKGKKIHRIPDVAFHLLESFENIIEQKTYKLGAPFFCIEVVSNKNSLKQELEKMEYEWMQAGVKIGIVVCPFREEYYLFEENKASYKTFGFTKVFIHPLLPELELDFQAILQEAIHKNQ